MSTTHDLAPLLTTSAAGPIHPLPVQSVTTLPAAPVPQPVVVGVDGSAASDRALEWAIDEAHRRGLPIRLVHAREVGAYNTSTLLSDAAAWEDPQWVLTSAHERVTAVAPELALVEDDVLGIPASTALISASARADTVVVGARQHGAVGAAFLGSTSLRVASHAACPVVVVRDLPEQATGTPRIVVGVDGSATSDQALAYAFDRASALHVPLTIVHAWPGDLTVEVMRVADAVADEVRAATANAQRTAIEEQIAPWGARFPDVAVHVVVPAVKPMQALVEESATASLVVVGSRGLGSLRGMLLGSVSEGVLHHAHCPVAVVRPAAPGD
ncbi:MAG: universal stress protein [Lapillicoccus sp.]